MQERKKMALAERLIVAADFKPDDLGWRGVRQQVISLCETLSGTGVYIKVNSVLRACGYNLIDAIHSHGLKVFADLKLNDIPETLATDGALLREVKPELLTVMCTTGIASMSALKTELPDTEILGVTVLTSLTEAEVLKIYRYPAILLAVRDLSELAFQAGIGGVVCSAKEAETLRRNLGDSMTINTPAIRPSWSIVAGDDQNQKRVMTPADAIKAGADRIVVGRPIVRATDPHKAVMRTLEEIASVVG